VWATTDRGALDLVRALTGPLGAPPPAPSEGGPGPAGGADPGAADPGAPAGGGSDRGAPAGAGSDPGAVAPVAAFDSGDWRRRLVAAPLLVFLVVLATVSVAAARRSRWSHS
jgi:hypothetical protein